ncbi:MAG: ferredoxin, partial [Mollicutes bacterium]|nr:ferredoxin [Mollicutes bacterium]
GGLSDAVNEALKEQNSDFVVKPVKASGLDQCKLNLNRIKKNTFQGNFLEGMACCNGCIGGPGCLTHQLSDQAKIDRFSKTSTIPTITSAIEKSGIASDISSIKK